jgi:hypothetical protein
MTPQQIQKALEEALNSLAQAESELLEQILEKDELMDYSGEIYSAQRSVEQMLRAVRLHIEKQQKKEVDEEAQTTQA